METGRYAGCAEVDQDAGIPGAAEMSQTLFSALVASPGELSRRVTAASDAFACVRTAIASGLLSARRSQLRAHAGAALHLLAAVQPSVLPTQLPAVEHAALHQLPSELTFAPVSLLHAVELELAPYYVCVPPSQQN